MKVTLRERELKSGNKSLFLDIYVNGKRSYEFLKLYLTGDGKADKQTKDLAEAIRAKRQLAIAHGNYGFTASFKKNSSFIEYVKTVRDSFDTSTKKQYNNLLKKIVSYKGQNIKFSHIDKRFCEGLKEHLLDELQETTARVYFSMFKAIMNRAVNKDEIIASNPADKVGQVKKTNGKKIEYLTADELQKLSKADCPDEHLKLAFLFSCYTGLRFSDVDSLRWDEVNGSRIEFKQNKTNQVEYLDLNETAKAILNRLPKNTDRVFNLPTNAYCNTLLKQWAKNAGLKKWIRKKDPDTGEIVQRGLTYHVSRHTFAVQILATGGSIYTLKELLGHQSIQSTEVYAQVVNKTKQGAVNNLPGVEI